MKQFSTFCMKKKLYSSGLLFYFLIIIFLCKILFTLKYYQRKSIRFSFFSTFFFFAVNFPRKFTLQFLCELCDFFFVELYFLHGKLNKKFSSSKPVRLSINLTLNYHRWGVVSFSHFLLVCIQLWKFTLQLEFQQSKSKS